MEVEARGKIVAYNPPLNEPHGIGPRLKPSQVLHPIAQPLLNPACTGGALFFRREQHSFRREQRGRSGGGRAGAGEGASGGREGRGFRGFSGRTEAGLPVLARRLPVLVRHRAPAGLGFDRRGVCRDRAVPRGEVFAARSREGGREQQTQRTVSPSSAARMRQQQNLYSCI
eukprot:SAG22_NODE_99_length_20560_cov_128.669029_15_plen_171_part_00